MALEVGRNGAASYGSVFCIQFRGVLCARGLKYIRDKYNDLLEEFVAPYIRGSPW